MTNNEFLNWIADRLVNVYGESPNVDFVHKLRALAQPEKPQPDRITTLRQLTENHSVDCLCADCVELDDIEEALAQPEQEPSEYMMEVTCTKCGATESGILKFTTTPQRTWVGLTPDEIRGISLASGESLFSAIMFTHDKLKEKNT